MSKKVKKKKQIRNRTGEMLRDYANANRQYTEENKRRQEEAGVQPKGLENLNPTEKICVAVNVLGGIGLIVRYVIL